MNKYLNYKDIIELCNDILNKEKLKNKLKFSSYIVNNNDFYKTNYFKNNIKLNNNIFDKLFFLLLPFMSKGFYKDIDKILFVYVHKFKTLPLNNTTHIIFILYHELFHAIQNNEFEKNGFNWSNYYEFISMLERIVINEVYIESKKYLSNHDFYMFEILADLYSIINTKKYIKENNMIIDTKFINKKEVDINERFLSYSSNLIDILIDYYSFFKRNKVINDDKFDIFFTKNGKIKKTKDIINDKRLNDIDKQITKAFLDSNSFTLKRSR